VTCNSWEHIWLNEGFATYFTHLWFQHRDGDDAYLAALYGTRTGLIDNDKSDPAPAPFVPAMSSKEYRHPWEVFRRGANPYPKGAFILHMLRERLGDSVFRAGIKLHLDRCSLKTAETDQFRQAMEEASGESLERFFHQWCFRPGVPKVAITPTWDASGGELVFRAVQTQPIDGYNPAFELSIPVAIRVGSSSQWTHHLISFDTREAESRIKLSGAPTVIAVDPRASVLADLRVTQPGSRWVAQLRDAPTIAARMQAIDVLAGSGDGAIAGTRPSALLTRLVRDRGEYHGLRSAAAVAVRKLKAGETLAELAESALDDARVRNTVLAELATAAREQDAIKDRSVRALRAALESDRSYAVRATAAKALGELRDLESLPLLVAATNTESQHDQIRQAAVEGLGAIDSGDAIEPVLKIAEPGHLARTRPVALKAVGKLANHDADRVFAALEHYLDDSEDRTRRGAMEGLVAAASERSRKPLERLAASSASEAERATAEQALRDLEKAIAEAREKKNKPVGSGWVAPRVPAGR
jgi:aminopeptidase N